MAFQVRHASQQHTNTRKVPVFSEQGFGQMNKVTYSLTVGEAARLFALMNISGNFTMLNYSKKISTISHCSFQLFKVFICGLCHFFWLY